MKSQLKSICFPVEKIETREVLKNAEMAYNSENAYAIVGSWPEIGRTKVLNFCSSVYKLIENALILEPLVPVLESKFKDLKISVGNDKDSQFTVRMSPVIPSFSRKGEVIKPAITFANSYDGKLLAQATGGLVRYTVDKKGVVSEMYSSFLQGLSFSYTFKHSNENIYSMEGISRTIDEYIANFHNVEKQIKMLKRVLVESKSNSDLEKLIRNLTKGTVFPLKEIEETIQRINYESEIFGTTPNLWTVYNSMNYILEYSESSLTNKMRIDADAKIYANVCEFFAPSKKKHSKKVTA